METPTSGHGNAWRTEATARGTRFVLPVRAIGGQRGMGLGIAAFGLAVLGVVLFLSRGLWWGGVAGLVGGAGAGWSLIGLALPVMVMLFTARIVRFGLLVAFGHSALTIDDVWITGVTRWGPLRTRRRVRIDRVRRVVVEPGLGNRRGRSDNRAPRDLANLVIDREHADERKRKIGLAHGYPHAVIDALAAEIGGRLDRPVATERPMSLREQNDRAQGTAPSGPAARVARPKRATGVLTETADGISIELPARGFFKGSKGLGSFSILWLGFISLFSSVFIGSMVRKGFGGGDLFAVAIISVFWLVGAGMLYGALRSGRRRGLIDVAGPDLLITRQSIGAAKAESWGVGEIERVSVGGSGVTVNDRPVLELQVWLGDGRKRGFFPERRDEELAWIAGEVSAALGIGAGDRGPGGGGDGDR